MENAATLLDELGHAFEYLKGAGGFNVKDQENFDAAIKEKCFPNK